MTDLTESDTDQLLHQAGDGDPAAVMELFRRHRPRLRQMVSIHLDPRLAARVDPSDIVQEALFDAQKELSDYLRDTPIPFYPWLRQLTWEQLVRHHRRHIQAQVRSVTKEEGAPIQLPDRSEVQLASRLGGSISSPSGRFLRAESRRHVQEALSRLKETDREVLVLRFLEQLSQKEAAAVLGITEGALNMRQLRALKNLQKLLAGHEGELH